MLGALKQLRDVRQYSKRIEKRSRRSAQTIVEETGGEVLIPESPPQLGATFQRLASDW
jgi:hypothetical protein